MMSKNGADGADDIFSQVVSTEVDSDRKELEKCMQEHNTSYLTEFFRMLFTWKTHPSMMPKKYAKQYDYLLEVLQDKNKTCITGSSTLCEAIREKEPDFIMDIGDIDIFLNLGPSLSSDDLEELQSLFFAPMLEELYTSYVKTIRNENLKIKDPGRTSNVIRTSAENYPITKDDHFDMQTFRDNYGPFKINIIRVTPSKNFGHWHDPKRDYTSDCPKPKFPYILNFIDSTFDFENVKYVWDFERRAPVMARRLLIKELETTSKIFLDYVKMQGPSSKFDFSARQLQGISDELSRGINLNKSDIKYPNFRKVEDNPKELIFSTKTWYRHRDLLSMNANLFMRIRDYCTRTDAEAEDDIMRGFPNNKFTVLRNEFIRITIPRVYKYINRGLSFTDTIGVFPTLKNSVELENFALQSAIKFKKITRGSILNLTIGALQAKEYGVARLEQEMKSITKKKEIDVAKKRCNTGTL